VVTPVKPVNFVTTGQDQSGGVTPGAENAEKSVVSRNAGMR
jgi:hypothetical protein